MIITSTLANFFSNLKNHYQSKKLILKLKKTKNIIQIVNILSNEGLIIGYEEIDSNNLNIFLKYNQENKPAIKNIQMISKPGKRVYVKNKWLYNNKPGIYNISTTSGYITNNLAKKYNKGGELICKII